MKLEIIKITYTGFKFSFTYQTLLEGDTVKLITNKIYTFIR